MYVRPENIDLMGVAAQKVNQNLPNLGVVFLMFEATY